MTEDKQQNATFKREFSPVIDVKFQSKPKKKQKSNPENKEEIYRIHRILINKYARVYIKFLHEKNQNNHYADVHFKSAMSLSSVKKYFTHWTYKDGVRGNGNNSIKQIDRNTYSIRLWINWHDKIMYQYGEEDVASFK